MISIRPQFALTILLLVLGGTASAWLLRTTPDSLYRRAIAVKDTDPKQAQKLLLHGIALANAEFPTANIALCELLLADGQCIEALGSFDGIKNFTTCDPNALCQLARSAMDHDCMLLAKLSAEAAATLPGDHQASALRIIASAFSAKQDWQSALQACNRWIEIEPGSSEAWAMQGDLLNRTLRPLPAVDAYRKALSLDPTQNPSTLRIRGSLINLLIAIGELDEARTHLNSMGESNRQSIELAVAEAKLLHLEGDLAAAKSAIDQVIIRCKDNCVDAFFIRGLIHFDLANYDLCIADLQKVIAIEPNHKESHHKLGRALLSIGQNDLAQQHLEISRKMTDAVIRSLSTDQN